MSRIRFHLDEHVDPDIARALRLHGIDITTTVEAELRTRSDAAQWEYIRNTQRVIVTHDADFLRLSTTTSDCPGIVFARRAEQSPGVVIRSLILIYEVLTAEEMVGRVDFL